MRLDKTDTTRSWIIATISTTLIGELARILNEHVRQLEQLNCYLVESIRLQTAEIDLDAIRNLHRCFHQIQLSEDSTILCSYIC